MRLVSRPALAGTLFALLCAAPHASATAITYTSYSSWVSNVTGAIELNFSGVSQSGTYSTSAGKTLVPLSGPPLSFVFTGPLSTSGDYLVGGSYGSSNLVSLFGPKSGTGTIAVALPSAGENALLIGLGNNGGSNSAFTITLSDGNSYTATVASAAQAFFGISISHTVTSLTISSGSSQAVVDDFWFASSKLAQDATGNQQASSPSVECSTLILIGSGLVGLVIGRRRLAGRFAAA
jgi:hypothetical protein